MRRIVFKSKGKLWPTVILPSNQISVYYIGESPDEVHIKESSEIDFEEFFLHLDKGGSVFVTLRPEPSEYIYAEEDHSHDSHLSNLHLRGGL